MEAKGAINEFTSTLFAVRLSPSIIYQSVNRYFLHPNLNSCPKNAKLGKSLVKPFSLGDKKY